MNPNNEENLPVVTENAHQIQHIEIEVQPSNNIPQQQFLQTIPPEVVQQRVNDIIKIITRTKNSTIYILAFGTIELVLFAVGLGIMPYACSQTLLNIFVIWALADGSANFVYSICFLQIITRDLNQIKLLRENHNLPYPLLALISVEEYKKGIRNRNVLLNLYFNLILISDFALFVFANVAVYSNLYSDCHIGYAEYDYIWAISFIYLIPRYFSVGITIIVLTFICLCFPCFYLLMHKARAEEEAENVSKRINATEVGKVSGKLIDGNQCHICLCPFLNDQEFSRLPCHREHAFHKSCIEAWFAKHSTCPLCRAELPNQPSTTAKPP